MKKLQLIIADHDSIYLKSFGEYILSSSSKARFEVKLFSSSDSLAQYLATENSFDILLIKRNIYEQELINDHKGLVLFLQEEAANLKADTDVFKYQPLNQLLSHILSLYYEKYTYQGGGSIRIKHKCCRCILLQGGREKRHSRSI